MLSLPIFLLFFILVAVVWFSSQGLFSALLHLFMVIIAGVIAFAFWEPLTMILMPMSIGIPLTDYAWGLGLILPFGFFLLLLRLASDQFVIGNLYFHNMIDRVGGATFGLISSILTAGIIMISFQMMDTLGDDGLNYYEINPSTQTPTVKGAAIIPMDRIAGNFFSTLSGGSFSPILTNKTLPRLHPNLATEAGLYNMSKTAHSKRALYPNNITLTDRGYFITKTAASKLPKPAGTDQSVVIGTTINLKAGDNTVSAVDKDRTFRITQAQVVLAYTPDENNNGEVKLIHPVGYIQRGEFDTIDRQDKFARSLVNAAEETFYWVFNIPQDTYPFYIKIKNARVSLQNEEPQSNLALVEALTTYDRTAQANNNEPIGPANTKLAKISPDLPATLNKNKLTSFEFNGNDIVKGTGRFTVEDEFFGDNIAVRKIYVNTEAARIVQIKLPSKQQDGSLLKKVIDFASQTASAPLILDRSGTNYSPIAFVKYKEDAEMTINVNFDEPIRSLSQLDLGALKDAEEVILYYLVPLDVVLDKWVLSKTQSFPLNIKVK